VNYLDKTLRPSLVKESQEGASFTIAGLPADHPARRFAHSLDPAEF
jgi:hypothetical protein